MKKFFKNFIGYAIPFAFLFLIGLFVNKGIIIKGLYKDDLFNWAWFPGLSLYDYAIKIYGASRYRPFFDMAQYLEYTIVGHNPILFVYVNIFLNSLVALFVYHFSKKLSKNVFIGFISAVLYISSHFAYYQIGQVLGLLETEAQFFALLILYICMDLVGAMKENEFENTFSVWKVIALLILYFVIAFTHERYLCLLPVIILSIIFSKTNKKKWPAYILFALEVITIIAIRHLATGKALPAGTGGTNVEETFSLITCIKYCFTQVAFIFGFNIGPEYLVGSEFIGISRRFIKFLGLASIVVIIVIAIIYLVKKINIEKETGKKPSFIVDTLFLLFIAMCIGASSVTIRIEMRFVYVSFTASILYLSYMCGYIYSLSQRSDKAITNGFFSIVLTLLFVAFFATRTPLELQYRTYYKNIHFFLDQDRVNSLYDNTIGKYGKDAILNEKTVYLVNQNYDFTDFYAKWFFTIYDKEYKNTPIILLSDISELPSDATSENAILLVEDKDSWRGYIETPIS